MRRLNSLIRLIIGFTVVCLCAAVMLPASVLLLPWRRARILLGNAYGKNKGSDYHFDWLENPYNFGRAMEVGGDCMGGKAKLRFNLGGTHVKDHGVMVFDSVVSLT